MILKAVIVYWTRTGNTKKLAEAIAAGLSDAGAEVEIAHIDSVPEDLGDLVVIGTPVHFWNAVPKIRSFASHSDVVKAALFCSYLMAGHDRALSKLANLIIERGGSVVSKRAFRGRPDQNTLREAREWGYSLAV